MKHDEMYRQVFSFVRDAPAEFVQGDEVTDWLNEGMLDIADRTGILQDEVTGFVNSDQIALPADFLRVLTLEVGDTAMYPPLHDNLMGGYVEDYEVFEGNILVRNTTDGTAYRMRYVRRPALLDGPDEEADLPVELQPKVVFYARAQGLYKEREDGMADRFMERYLEGLPPHPNASMRHHPGPKSLTYQKGPFD